MPALADVSVGQPRSTCKSRGAPHRRPLHLGRSAAPGTDTIADRLQQPAVVQHRGTQPVGQRTDPLAGAADLLDQPVRLGGQFRVRPTQPADDSAGAQPQPDDRRGDVVVQGRAAAGGARPRRRPRCAPERRSVQPRARRRAGPGPPGGRVRPAPAGRAGSARSRPAAATPTTAPPVHRDSRSAGEPDRRPARQPPRGGARGRPPRRRPAATTRQPPTPGRPVRRRGHLPPPVLAPAARTPR